MERRNFLKLSSVLGLLGITGKVVAREDVQDNKKKQGDREYWVSLLDKMATPVLANMSRGELRKNMAVEVSKGWSEKATKEVAYMEAFGRLIAGMAPWLELPDDGSKESQVRQRLRLQAQQSLAHAVDPASPDYLYWGTPASRQPLVDAAYIAQALLYAPKSLWQELDGKTKERIIEEFTKIRALKPNQSNWLLFAAMIETFLLKVDQPFDAFRIDDAIDKLKGWYTGDGWYKDGANFGFDHYNAYVMHPMMTDVLKHNVDKGRRTKEEYEQAYKRMQRYSTYLERYISPEGTYLVVGRSSTYRMAAFQPLVKVALENKLPAGLTNGQVRAALTAVMKKMFIPSTFTKQGWLTLGLVGDQQIGIADSYSNTGSMYITSTIFLTLGLSPEHAFWTDPAQEWTQQKAWSGKPFPKDYAVNY
jgi:hypothetical protein